MKFENVKINDTIAFEQNGKIETAVVIEVNARTFTTRALRSWDKNGISAYYDAFFNFYKSGIKSHSHYTYGNALEITGSV
jgi:hypothetical protein